jgi:hypothetical protein
MSAEKEGGKELEHSAYEKMPHDTQSWTVPAAWNKKSKMQGKPKSKSTGVKGTAHISSQRRVLALVIDLFSIN